MLTSQTSIVSTVVDGRKTSPRSSADMLAKGDTASVVLTLHFARCVLRSMSDQVTH